MTIEMLLSVISVMIGVLGIFYAWFSNREKHKLENMIRINLSGMAGDVIKIRQSAQWAWDNFQGVRELASQLPGSDIKEQVINKSQLGTGDAAAVERMLSILLNQVLNAQEGICGTTEVRQPDHDKNGGETHRAHQ